MKGVAKSVTLKVGEEDAGFGIRRPFYIVGKPVLLPPSIVVDGLAL